MSPSHSSPQRPIGRSDAIAAIDALLDAAEHGDSRCLAIVGPPGIGKTTVSTHARERARSRGLSTVGLRVPRAPHRASSEMIEVLCERLGPPQETPSILGIAGALSKAAPLLLVVDDWHAMSATEAEELVEAVRLCDAGIAFLITSRPPTTSEPGSQPLPVPSSDLRLDVLELEALNQTSITALLEQSLGGPPLPSLVTMVARTTKGNPLFVVEAVRHWQRRSRLSQRDGYWMASPEAEDDIPSTVLQLIASRMRSLSPSALNIARVLALVGRRAALEEVRSAAGIERSVALDAQDELARAHVINVAGKEIEIDHPLQSAALLQSLTRTERARHENGILEMLRARRDAGIDIPVSELALHAAESDLPQTVVIDELLAAYDEVAVQGRDAESRRIAEKLVDVVPAADPRTHQARFRLASSMMRTDPARAVELMDELLKDEPDPEQRSVLAIRRAIALRFAGRLEESLDTLVGIADVATGRPKQAVLRNIPVIRMLLGDIDTAKSELAMLYDTDPYSGTAANLAGIAVMRGALDEACDLFQRAITVGEHEASRLDHKAFLAFALTLNGRWSEAEALYAEIVPAARATGDPWLLSTTLTGSAWLNAWRGRFEEALDRATWALRYAGRISSAGQRLPSLTSMALVGNEFQLPAAGSEQLARTLEQDTPPEQRADHAMRCALVSESFVIAGETRLGEKWWLAAKERDGATLWHATIAHAGGRAALAAAEPAGCLDRIAPFLAEPGPIPFEQARLDELAGDARAARGERARARRHWENALASFEQLGSARRAERLRTQLAGRRQELGQAWVLTAREREVAALVVAGLTNAEIAERLIVTPATAKKHVENILRKANARRRGDLARLAPALGIPLDAAEPQPRL